MLAFLPTQTRIRVHAQSNPNLAHLHSGRSKVLRINDSWGGGGGGYSLTVAIRVCAAQRGRVFGHSDLERGIIFKPFSITGCNIPNARKLENIIGDFNSRTGC